MNRFDRYLKRSPSMDGYALAFAMLALTAVLLFSGCGACSDCEDAADAPYRKYVTNEYRTRYEVITIEGHLYLRSSEGGITHYHNCAAPSHNAWMDSIKVMIDEQSSPYTSNY